MLSFEFGDAATSAPRVGIDLPYAAFDLEASWPLFNTSQRYFPIRRANSSSQYTLGRAFMQEAYLIVDYERRNFSIHQAVFSTSSEQKIVAIPSEDTSLNPRSHVLNRASIAGIITGVLVFCILLVLLSSWLYRRRKIRSGGNVPQLTPSSGSRETQETYELQGAAKRSFLMSNEVLELQMSREKELDGKVRNELE